MTARAESLSAAKITHPEACPLSAGQQALWFLNRAVPESRSTNLACVAQVREDVDLDLLKQVLQSAFERHPSVRARFPGDDCAHLRQIFEDRPLSIETVDSSAWDRARLSRRILEEALRGFDLAKGPVCRLTLYTHSDEGPVLQFTAHHISFDGWSLWLCLREICALYAARKAGKADPLQPVRGHYADFVRWQEELLGSDKGEKQFAFWKKALAGERPVLDLPTDRPRSGAHAGRAAELTFRFGLRLTERLKKLAAREGTTLYTVLLAAWESLLHRTAQQDVILVGSPTAGRSRSELKGTTGYFVNPVVMRGDFTDDPPFDAFLKRLHRTVRSALVHQHYPLPRLVERLFVERSPERTPLFQTSFTFQKPDDPEALAAVFVTGDDAPPFDIGGLDLGPVTIVQHEDQYDVALEMAEVRGTLPGVLKYRADLFDASRVKKMARSFERILEEVVADPGRAVSALPIDGPAEARTDTERSLAAIWDEVLQAGPVGRSSSFFDLGGHSLLATQVVSRVRDVFGVEVPIRAIFEAPTVAGLAARIDEMVASAERQAAGPPIRPEERTAEIPLSYSQERMWFLHQMDPDGAAYNMGVAFSLEGRFDLAVAEKCLAEIVRRHENLRTTFHSNDGQPVMRIANEGAIPIERVDLTRLPEKERLDEARRLASEAIRAPYDLSRGPLHRVTAYVIGPEQTVVLFRMHHIISDLWTFGVLFEELAALYPAYLGGGESPLFEPELQYADFACWQRRWFGEGVLDEQLAFWKEQLAGAPIVPLPTDHPRPAIRTVNGSILSRALPASLIEKVVAFSAREGVTPYMTLLAAFKVLLMRYTGLEDIVVGSPIANRTRVEVEGMTGTFVNTLVMRSDLSGAPTFRELVDRVRKTTLAAYAHQDLPFEKLVEEIRPQRDMSYAPLVQVLFNLANAPFEAPAIRDLAWSPVEIDRGAAQFDLSLFVDLEISEKVFAEFNTDLFEPATIDRLLGHFVTLVEALVAAPGGGIGNAPILTRSESAQLVISWNRTESANREETCFHRLFEEQARRTPDAIALSQGGKALTYVELNGQANRIARRLTVLGAAPGVFVGIHMERTPEMISALLAIQKTGAAYLPLDPAFPRDRLAFMIEDTEAPIIVTTSDLAGSLVAGDATLFAVDAQEERTAAESAHDLPPQAGPDDLAYILYTSGSTGKPKGVQIGNRALVNFLESMRLEPGLDREDVLLAVTTLSFDISMLEILLPLMVGARLELADRETAYDGNLITERLAASEATVMQATPATWRMLIDSGWDGQKGLKVLCGGEALTRGLADELLERCDSLWNMYGPTETTIWSAVCPIGKGNDPILIGRPIANTQIYVLDRLLQPVPVGVPGELFIGGHGLAAGYLNRDELTEEKFIASPFAEDEKIYGTGDMARYLPDGRIECLGRIDNQVKIRGFRIELGEIETALAAHAAVRESVVVAREEKPGINGLVAYVVADGKKRLSLGEMRNHLKRTLPDYMIPTALVTVDALPLTPNGKVDRRALPDPDGSSTGLEESFVAPRTDAERKLAAIWSDVLGVSRVGVNDDFFDLGGHSLLAARLADRIRRALEIDLPLRSVFLDSTVAGMARKITTSEETEELAYTETPQRWISLVPVQPKGTRRPFFLVSGTYSEENRFLGYMANLVAYLGTDQPVYGFRARGLDGKENPHANVEEMARDYVREMRDLQPEGPYLIGGECVGGVVAYEMARQLRDAGEEIGLLLMMDTVYPSWTAAFRFRWALARMRIAHLGARVGTLFQGGFAAGMKRIGAVLESKRRSLVPMSDDERTESRIARTERVYAEHAFAYKPAKCPDRITLIASEEEFARDPFAGWRKMAPAGFAVHRVPGDHLTRITENVEITARRVRACLDEVQGFYRGRPDGRFNR